VDFSPRVNDEAGLTDVERENKNISQRQPYSDQSILASRTGSLIALTDSTFPELRKRGGK
jgi:hypothetical protein